MKQLAGPFCCSAASIRFSSASSMNENSRLIATACGASASQLLAQLPQTIFIQRGQRFAVRAQSRIHFEAKLWRDQRRLFLGLQVVQLLARLAADAEHVGQAPVGDVRRAHALAFEHRVGGHGRAVNQQQVGSVYVEVGQALQDGALGGVRRGQDFVYRYVACVFVKQDKVGESTTGVYAEICH